MSTWNLGFGIRSAQRDLDSDLDRVAFLDAALGRVVESVRRERQGLQGRLAGIAADAAFAEPDDDGAGRGRLAACEAQMIAASARLAELDRQIDYYSRLRREIDARLQSG